MAGRSTSTKPARKRTAGRAAVSVARIAGRGLRKGGSAWSCPSTWFTRKDSKNMAKVHQYILVAADGTCGITKSNGPICVQQSRQEVGGHSQAFDPKIGEGYTAQINEADA